MIVKIQQTKERKYTKDQKQSAYYDSWVYFDNVKEVHELEPRDYNENDLNGQVFLSEDYTKSGSRFLNHLFLLFEDGAARNIYYERSAFLMNNNGKTIQSL